MVFMSHWISAVIPMMIPVLMSIAAIPAKSTCPLPTIRSIASPTRIGA